MLTGINPSPCAVRLAAEVLTYRHTSWIEHHGVVAGADGSVGAAHGCGPHTLKFVGEINAAGGAGHAGQA